MNIQKGRKDSRARERQQGEVVSKLSKVKALRRKRTFWMETAWGLHESTNILQVLQYQSNA